MPASMMAQRAGRGAGLTFLCPMVERLEERLCLAASPMTVGEQHLHELLNWVRANPSAAAQQYSTALNEGLPAGTITATAKPPLARNDLLRTAMTAHLQDMQSNDFFSHTGSNGSTFDARIRAAGYTPYRALGENLVWWGVSSGSLPDTRQVAANLVESWFKSPTHRQNLMDPEFREVGTAMIISTSRYQGVHQAGIGGQDFGKRDVDSFLTGVGCRTNRTDFPICDVTAAVSRATVTATRRSDQLVRTTTTSTTGGYDLQLPNGIWDVRIVGGELPEPVELNGLVISGQNVKRDFAPVFTNRWHNTVNPLDVNNDKVVSPQDVLIIVNDLNANGARQLPYVTTTPRYLVDVNRDVALSPADALQIVNHLNSRAGEGENHVAGSIVIQRREPAAAVLPVGLEDDPAEALAPRSAGAPGSYAAALDALLSRLEEDDERLPLRIAAIDALTEFV